MIKNSKESYTGKGQERTQKRQPKTTFQYWSSLQVIGQWSYCQEWSAVWPLPLFQFLLSHCLFLLLEEEEIVCVKKTQLPSFGRLLVFNSLPGLVKQNTSSLGLFDWFKNRFFAKFFYEKEEKKRKRKQQSRHSELAFQVFFQWQEYAMQFLSHFLCLLNYKKLIYFLPLLSCSLSLSFLFLFASFSSVLFFSVFFGFISSVIETVCMESHFLLDSFSVVFSPSFTKRIIHQKTNKKNA